MNETLESILPFRDQQNMDTDIEYPGPGNVALEYACTSWHTHLSESRDDVAALIPALHHFLEDKLAAWLGVLGGLEADPVFALNKVISWLKEVCLGLF